MIFSLPLSCYYYSFIIFKFLLKSLLFYFPIAILIDMIIFLTIHILLVCVHLQVCCYFMFLLSLFFQFNCKAL